MTTIFPRTADEVIDAIRWAMSAGEPLEVIGNGTRRALGRPVDARHLLDVSSFSGVMAYEPEELILTAHPATPLAEIELLLAERGQCLAFEPPYLAGVMAATSLTDNGSERSRLPGRGEDGRIESGGAREGIRGGGVISGEASLGVSAAPPIARASADQNVAPDSANPTSRNIATLGGAIATGLSGPRRPKAGAVRDHLLGITAVSGRGELFTAGGKVVKNVTGYDIPKLIAGSYGTLAVLTEVTVKVLPAPQDTKTLLIHGMPTPAAVRAMTEVLQSKAETSAACHLPPGITAPGKPTADSTTAFRLEGVTPSVDFRLARLREQLTSAGSLSVLDRDSSPHFWQAIRDVTPFATTPTRMLWRISVPPAQGAEVLARIEHALPGSQAYLDWGGGLIWLQPDAESDALAAIGVAEKIRAALAAQGHATLIRAPADVRRAVDVFHPQPAALAALSKRVKAQFDPKQILNPGRMYAGV